MWLNLQHFSTLFISVKRKEKKKSLPLQTISEPKHLPHTVWGVSETLSGTSFNHHELWFSSGVSLNLHLSISKHQLFLACLPEVKFE